MAIIRTLIDRTYKINNTSSGFQNDLIKLSDTLKRNSFPSHCSVVTSVNHTSTRSKRNSHSPCSRCEHGVNKSELSFDFRWFYLNGTTPHLATRIHGAHPVREFKSQRADKAIQVPKRGQRNSNPKARTRQS